MQLTASERRLRADELLARLAAQSLSVKRLCADSRQLAPGDVFLAYPGARSDGRQFIADVAARGAIAVLWERQGFSWPEDIELPNIACDALSELAGEMAARLVKYPSSRMRVIGVTGTNGKTSITQWLARALSGLGNKCAVIGTLGMGFPGALEECPNTTPDALSLQHTLARVELQGARAVAIEASSIGIEQGRVNGVEFDTAVFTNLTRDHLDYHGSMQAYAAAKARLFAWPGLRVAVLNLDDEFGVELAQRCIGQVSHVIGYTCGDSPEQLPAGVHVLAATELRGTATGEHFDVLWAGQRAQLETRLVGRFNVSNLLAVLACLLAGGSALEDAVTVLQSLSPPPGRMQALGGVMEPLVVVDYAHTPDALEQALGALRPTASARGGRLICVFGCGGERDPGKRPLMGAAATRRADEVLITSDNPRSEVPERIIEAIAAACDGRAHCIVSRRAAILASIRHARADDVILIAGKGHETYQEVAGQRSHFSDVEEARAALHQWALAQRGGAR